MMSKKHKPHEIANAIGIMNLIKENIDRANEELERKKGPMMAGFIEMQNRAFELTLDVLNEKLEETFNE